jgi:PAS domain S-box-containing protein
MALRTDRKIVLAVASASVFVVAVAIVGVVSTRRLLTDAERVAHTQEVRAELRELTAHIDAAKADVRGYLLTGDSAYVGRQRASVAASEATFQRLRQLTADDPEQQGRMAVMRGLLTSREAALEQTLVVRPRPGEFLAAVGARLAIGEALAARIDSVVLAADSTEQRLLADRSAKQVDSEGLIAAVSLLLVLTAVGLALALGRSIGRDYTGRARAEAAARASEAKFAGILAIAADAIITTNEKQTILHFNDGAEEIFGYRRMEVLGRPLEMLFPERHAGTLEAHVAGFPASNDAARRMGERRSIHGRRKNGEEFHAEASISKLQTPEGLLYTAVVRDVTEQKRLEHHEHALAMAGVQLAQSLEYDDTLRAVAGLPVPSVGAWSMLDIVDASEPAETALRRVASRHLDPAVDAALREWQAEPLDWDSPDRVIDVLRTGEIDVIPVVSDDWLDAHVADERQFAIARRMGTRSLIIAPLVAHGPVLGALTIGSAADHVFDDYDVALAQALAERAALAIENAALFRQAHRATAARDQVLSVVSHEVRNPLSAVSMLARRLAERPTSPDESRSIGMHILASADWMHHLMQDLLDAASIDAGKLSVELQAVAPRRMVDPVLGMFAERASEKGVALCSEMPSPGPQVFADEGRVIQVVSNLVGNALKFTPGGGTITVGTTDQGDELAVWVRDTGSGIPPQDLPHVFDRFWHARRSSATPGSGLGLAIAHGIVRAHGGRVWAESTEGEGSTFFFTLPVARTA